MIDEKAAKQVTGLVAGIVAPYIELPSAEESPTKPSTDSKSEREEPVFWALDINNRAL
jgi:hypothetical protein